MNNHDDQIPLPAVGRRPAAAPAAGRPGAGCGTKPGYRTSEHAVTWAVIALAAVALFRGRGELASLAAVVSPAVASAAYSASRGRVKAPLADPAAAGTGPPPPAVSDADVRRLLGELFRGRIVK